MNEQQQGYMKKELTTNKKIIDMVEWAIENNNAEKLFQLATLFDTMGMTARKLDAIFNTPYKTVSRVTN